VGVSVDACTLETVPPGHTVLLARIDDSLAPDFREQLAAYGFVPGRALEVLAQQPMTVVVCDHVELALEASIARALVVRRAGPGA
jgi:Fe2+ transport system protein FeoA